jgi:hypothetical protein
LAYGRDVNVAEIGLDYDTETRLLSYAPEAGSRNADRLAALTAKAADVVIARCGETGGPINKSELEDALGQGGTTGKRNAIRQAISHGWIRMEPGPNKAQLHYPGDVDPHHVTIPR